MRTCFLCSKNLCDIRHKRRVLCVECRNEQVEIFDEAARSLMYYAFIRGKEYPCEDCNKANEL